MSVSLRCAALRTCGTDGHSPYYKEEFHTHTHITSDRTADKGGTAQNIKNTHMGHYNGFPNRLCQLVRIFTTKLVMSKSILLCTKFVVKAHQSPLKLHRIDPLSVLSRTSLVQILTPGSPFQICLLYPDRHVKISYVWSERHPRQTALTTCSCGVSF